MPPCYLRSDHLTIIGKSGVGHFAVAKSLFRNCNMERRSEHESSGMEETVQGRSKSSLDDGKPQAGRDQSQTQAMPRREHQSEMQPRKKPAAASIGGILREL